MYGVCPFGSYKWIPLHWYPWIERRKKVYIYEWKHSTKTRGSRSSDYITDYYTDGVWHLSHSPLPPPTLTAGSSNQSILVCFCFDAVCQNILMKSALLTSWRHHTYKWIQTNTIQVRTHVFDAIRKPSYNNFEKNKYGKATGVIKICKYNHIFFLFLSYFVFWFFTLEVWITNKTCMTLDRRILKFMLEYLFANVFLFLSWSFVQICHDLLTLFNWMLTLGAIIVFA